MQDPYSLYSEVYDRGRLKTAYGLKSKSQNFHYFLQGKDEITNVSNHKQYFTGRTEIFTNALLIGFFLNKKSAENANDSFNRVSDVHDEHEVIVKMIFLDLCKRPENINKNPSEMLSELCRYADGGIEYLIEHYNENQDLNMREILDDVTSKMKKMTEQIKSEINPISENDSEDSTKSDQS